MQTGSGAAAAAMASALGVTVAPARRCHEELIRVGQEMKEAGQKETTVF